MRWRKKDVSENLTVSLERNQKYVEAVRFLGQNVQIVTCGWTDWEKMLLQNSLRMNPGTVNCFVWPYIKTEEAQA